MISVEDLSLEVNPARIRQDVRYLLEHRSVQSVLEEYLQEALGVVVSKTPGTAAFKDGWFIVKSYDRSGKVRYDFEHETANKSLLKWLEFGTKPHRIVPRNRQFLRFTTSEARGPSTGFFSFFTPFLGRRDVVIFAKEVNHPGTKPYEMVQSGVLYLNQSLNNIRRDMLRQIKRLSQRGR